MGKIDASSSYLPPNKSPSNAKLWGIVVEPPMHKDVKFSPQIPKKCPNCNCFLCLANGKCPICEGDVSLEDNAKFIEDYKFIQKKIELPRRLISFILDLSIPGVLLHQVAYSLMQDSFLNRFTNDDFMLVLLGSSPIYVCKQNGFIHLQCGYIQNDSFIYKFNASEIPDIIEQVLLLISSGSFNVDPTTPPLTDVLRALSVFGTNLTILFYDSLLPQIPQLNFAVHCIYVSTPSSATQPSILTSYENKWTHAIVKQAQPSLSEYVCLLLDNNVPAKSTTTITLSNGLQFEWISPPFDQMTKKVKQCVIDCSNCSYLSAIIATVGFTGAYKSHNQFRIQISSAFDDGTIYVSNYIYKKSPSLQEYQESFNFSTFVTIMMRQFSNDYFSNLLKSSFWGIFDKKIIWDIDTLFGDLILQRYAKTAFKRFTKLVSETSPVKQCVKESIIFSIVSLGPSYIGDLINSLLTPPKGDNIYITPYLFWKSGSAQPETASRDLLHGGTVTIIELVSEDVFNFIQEIYNISG